MYCHYGEEYSETRGNTTTIPNYPLKNYEEKIMKLVVLKSSSTKRMTATQILEKKTI